MTVTQTGEVLTDVTEERPSRYLLDREGILGPLLPTDVKSLLPNGLPSAISRTKRGTSTPTGQAVAHGGGAYGPAQKRQRSASNSAASMSRGGLSSEKALIAAMP